MNKVNAIIQARLSSTRLPAKMLKKIVDKALLEHVIERIQRSKYIDKIIVATTTNSNDGKLCDLLDNLKIPYFRGSENDVLERYYQTAKHFQCKYIARITPDDPFKDPEVIDKVIEMFFNGNLDFAYNNHPATFPEGLDTEIFSFDALKKAQKESKDTFEREHVTQYFYRHPELFEQNNLENNVDLSYLRWTIDTKEDLQMAREVYRKLYKDKPIFLMDDILHLIKNNPVIVTINNNVKRSHMYRQNK